MNAASATVRRDRFTPVSRFARVFGRVYGGSLPWLRTHACVINANDRRRLYDAFPYATSLPPHLTALLDHLAAATPLPPDRVPHDLVTMNSILRLRDPISGGLFEAELVYPYDADRLPHARSVAAPFGAAAFGRRVGDAVTWSTPRGVHTVIIDSLAYQPERDGDLDR